MAKKAEAVMYMIQWYGMRVGKQLSQRRFKVDWEKRWVVLKNVKNDSDAIKEFQAFKGERIKHEEYKNFKLLKFERTVLAT